MSTYIDLDDRRSWWAANWAYDTVVESIANELTTSQPERELACWLRNQTCLKCGPGIGSIDVRELSPRCRTAFHQAARHALKSAEAKGDAGWQQPEFFPGWIAKFRELVELMDAVERGQPVAADTHFIEPTGRRVGPGWLTSDEQTDELEPE